MAQEVSVNIIIKTFGIKYSEKSLKELIDKALWSVPEFRDVFIYDFKVLDS